MDEKCINEMQITFIDNHLQKLERYIYILCKFARLKIQIQFYII